MFEPTTALYWSPLQNTLTIELMKAFYKSPPVSHFSRDIIFVHHNRVTNESQSNLIQHKIDKFPLIILLRLLMVENSSEQSVNVVNNPSMKY